jgi:phthalate 4,5-dioxygenase oxygenase subunit
MLNASDNELLTQISPGIPMGNLIRQYWLPALASADLAEADSKPFRVRLLGENLIAVRDTRGIPRVISEFCPPRGASLYWSRNEEGGLRCVYHG